MNDQYLGLDDDETAFFFLTRLHPLCLLSLFGGGEDKGNDLARLRYCSELNETF